MVFQIVKLGVYCFRVTVLILFGCGVGVSGFICLVALCYFGCCGWLCFNFVGFAVCGFAIVLFCNVTGVLFVLVIWFCIMLLEVLVFACGLLGLLRFWFDWFGGW